MRHSDYCRIVLSDRLLDQNLLKSISRLWWVQAGRVRKLTRVTLHKKSPVSSIPCATQKGATAHDGKGTVRVSSMGVSGKLAPLSYGKICFRFSGRYR